MKTTTIELFMPLSAADGLASCGADALLASGIIEKTTLWCGDASDIAIADERVTPVAVKSLSASRLFMNMASSATADYVLYVAKEGCSLPGADVLGRMLDAMAADSSVSSTRQLHSAASYTSISSGSPFLRQYIRRLSIA